MRDITGTLVEKNIIKHDDCLAITATQSSWLREWAAALITGTVFLMIVIGVLTAFIVRDELQSVDYVFAIVMGVFAIISGYMTYIYAHANLFYSEVLLYPKHKKIVLREMRTKKIKSEHAIENIEIQTDRVMHSDPARLPMAWFTIYDTKLDKKIFSIRPESIIDLEEFFYEEMAIEKPPVTEELKKLYRDLNKAIGDNVEEVEEKPTNNLSIEF